MGGIMMCMWHQQVPCEKPPCVTWPSPALCASSQLCLCLLWADGLPSAKCVHPMGERLKRKGCKICSFPQWHGSSLSWADCWRKWELAQVGGHWGTRDSRRQKGIHWGRRTCQRVLHQEGDRWDSSTLRCSFLACQRAGSGPQDGQVVWGEEELVA